MEWKKLIFVTMWLKHLTEETKTYVRHCPVLSMEWQIFGSLRLGAWKNGDAWTFTFAYLSAIADEKQSFALADFKMKCPKEICRLVLIARYMDAI